MARWRRRSRIQSAFLAWLPLAALAQATPPARTPPPPTSYETGAEAEVAADAALPEEAERAPRPPPPEGWSGVDGDVGRIALMPTAFLPRRKRRTFNNFDLGTFEFELPLTEELYLGIQTAVPVGFVGLGASLRAGRTFRYGAVGLHAQVFGGWLFFDDTDGAVLGGGGPILTLGSRDHHINLGTSVYGVLALKELGNRAFGLLVPHLGGSFRVARWARVVAELWLPFRTDGARDFGELLVLLYGFRVFGRAGFWVDAGLFRHVCRPACTRLYRRLPPGLPYLNIGRRF